jgi:hypothetical protein
MSTDEMRNVVRHQLETLERWLRRLIDDAIRAHYQGDFSALPIKKAIKDDVVGRRGHEPHRYPRDVDALLFDDLVTICHPQIYKHFRDAVKGAFPNGVDEARTFLDRIIELRNPAAHANDITSHQAMRVMCYSTDVIGSLKAYYARNNLADTYNAPSFLRVFDTLGNNAQVESTQWGEFRFNDTPLRPGDIVHLEVQPDESFFEDSYRIQWTVCNVPRPLAPVVGRQFSLSVEDFHVTQDGLPIRCEIISNLNWHRHGTYDARFHVYYPVLPPI